MILNARTLGQRRRRYQELSSKLMTKLYGSRKYTSVGIQNFMELKVDNRSMVQRKNIDRLKKMISQLDRKGELSQNWSKHDEIFKKRQKSNIKRFGKEAKTSPVYALEWIEDTEQLKKYHAETDPEKKLEMEQKFNDRMHGYHGIDRNPINFESVVKMLDNQGLVAAGLEKVALARYDKAFKSQQITFNKDSYFRLLYNIGLISEKEFLTKRTQFLNQRGKNQKIIISLKKLVEIINKLKGVK